MPPSSKIIKKETSKNRLVSDSARTLFSGKYIEGLGRRKTAVARVRLFPDSKGLIINGRTLAGYFPLLKDQRKILSPLKLIDLDADKVGLNIVVKGGGTNAQTEAIRLGVSRSLVKFNSEWRPKLKSAEFLKRDPRMVERKKYGLRKARRAPQWRKR